MLVHASANEFKNGPKGLYPNSDVWYYDAIQTEYLEGTSRYLRYITGTTAERFYEIAKMLITFNEERNCYFVRKVLNEYLDKEVLSVQHYGMPNNLTKEIEVSKANDEISLLTESFNKMKLKLNDAFQSQKQFTANAAHELRTPLAVMMTNLEVFIKTIYHLLKWLD